jgi:Domain of unknown function (DUF4267)
MSQPLPTQIINNTILKTTAAVLIGTLSTTLGLRGLLYPLSDVERFGLGANAWVYPVPTSQLDHESDGRSMPQHSAQPERSGWMERSEEVMGDDARPQAQAPAGFGAASLNPFALACGLRNISFGLTQFAFAYLRDWRALGVIWLCGVVVAVGDGWLVVRFGGGNGRGEEEFQGREGKGEDDGEGEGEAEGGNEDQLKTEKVGENGKMGSGSQRPDRSWRRIPAKAWGHWGPGTVIVVGGALLAAGY